MASLMLLRTVDLDALAS